MGAPAPRFRRDLTAAEVQADGVLYIEVTDTRSGKSFRFYDFEYAVAQKLDGRTLEQVAQDLQQNLQLELNPEQLAAFADQLRSLGFLDEAEGFFPPLIDDESGEFNTPSLRASAPAATGETPATPAPILGDPAPAGQDPTARDHRGAARFPDRAHHHCLPAGGESGPDGGRGAP